MILWTVRCPRRYPLDPDPIPTEHAVQFRLIPSGTSGIANVQTRGRAYLSAEIHHPTLPCSGAVETSGIIRPLRIAEIERAAGEVVRSHRGPGGNGEIRGSLDHDDQVAGAVNGEPELIRLHASTSHAGLRLRLPQRRLEAGRTGK